YTAAARLPQKFLSFPPAPLSFSKTFYVRFFLLHYMQKGKSTTKVWRKRVGARGKCKDLFAFGKVGCLHGTSGGFMAYCQWYAMCPLSVQVRKSPYKSVPVFAHGIGIALPAKCQPISW
ncbi:MAG: hypothetical protein J6S73_07270, partial [Lentisphaeria bacterium]|nr:hypothetical protein [Lentisphaeria bacterium]